MLNSQLLKPLAKCLDANLARLKCLSLLVEAVLRHRTVNLTILATTEDGKNCTTQSRYRRFQDFFLKFALPLPAVSRFIVQRIPKPRDGFVLAIDRTNWEFGHQSINILTIAVIIGKVSIPVMWKVLPKKSRGGNSNCKQRIALLRKLLTVLAAQDIHALTMDREFVGKPWLKWLDDQDIGYVVRVKKNTAVGWRDASDFASLPGPRSAKRQDIFGMKLYFASKRMKAGGRSSQLLVVSNRFQGRQALNLYRMRWGIERLFGHLKKKGFDLETTHMTAPQKLEKLFAVVVLAFLLSFGWGCQLRDAQSKGGGAALSRRKSFFRLGLEDLLTLLQTWTSPPPGDPHLKAFKNWLNQPQFNSIFLV